jgi:hypothetical protein
MFMLRTPPVSSRLEKRQSLRDDFPPENDPASSLAHQIEVAQSRDLGIHSTPWLEQELEEATQRHIHCAEL